MKRAGVLSESSLDQPRRSKRLAKTNITQNASSVAVMPSVVSISSNEGSSNNTNNTINNTKPPPVHAVFRNFPQDAIQQVNAMLPIFTEQMDEAANDSDDDEDDDDTTSPVRQLKYIQLKECVFRICKFALQENSFLGKDEETRQVQATAMNTLIYASPISSNETKELELVETFLQVIIARGNILPPKSLHLFQQTDDELWQEIHTAVYTPTMPATTPHKFFATFLIAQGEKLVELHNSKISLANFLMRHDFIKLTQTVELIQVQRAIVQLWMHLLQDDTTCWNASNEMRMEQLENAHASFIFCKHCLLSADDLKSLDVKMMLWKLALYCSYAMDWPADTCSLEEKEVLKLLGTMVRR